MHFGWLFLGYAVCGIFERQSFNHRTTKEVPNFTHFKVYSLNFVHCVRLCNHTTVKMQKFPSLPKLLHAHFCP